MKKLTPPKINKLTKKELKKAYTNTWRLNLNIAWQKFKLEDFLDKYEWWMRIAENEIVHKNELLSDTQEALERRRILYDRLANHSTIQKPKSMNEMAEALYIQCMAYGISEYNLTPFNELTQESKDIWMNNLLTILN